MSKTAVELPFHFGAPLGDQCSHGKLWTEVCHACRIIFLKDSLGRMEKQVMRDRAELERLESEVTDV